MAAGDNMPFIGSKRTKPPLDLGKYLYSDFLSRRKLRLIKLIHLHALISQEMTTVLHDPVGTDKSFLGSSSNLNQSASHLN